MRTRIGIEQLEVRQYLSAVSPTAISNDGATVAAAEISSSDSIAPSRPEIAPVNSGTQVTINWLSVAAAETYEIWINNRVTGEQEVVRENGITATSFSVLSDQLSGRRRPLPGEVPLPEGYYRVWVRATNTAGHSDWSAPEDFTLGDPDPLEAPPAPAVTGPAGTSVSVRPVITWTAADTADTYELWVNNLTTGTSQVIHQQALTGTSFDVTRSLAAGTYRVWVRAANEAGNGDWSEAADFTVPLAPDVPQQPVITAVLPARGGVVIEWTAADTADSWEIWINNRITGEQEVIRQDELTQNSFIIAAGRPGRGDAAPEGYYRVWVRATNTAGHSDWSDPFDFTLGAPATT